MQPSAKWGTDYVRLFGANIRAGASDINDPDFTNYPAFHFNQIDTYPGNSYMHVWWLYFNVFPLNQPITDWTFAYTGVDSSELSHTNIGVFDSADYTTPKYKTDNTNIQQIAFLNNLRYYINVNDHAARPRWPGVPQFPVPPYNNNLYVYGPNAAGGTVDPNTFNLSQVNFNGYATTIRSFGIKSWFLEIRVSTVFIGTAPDTPLPNEEYTLKEYLSFSQHERDVNPISRAFARVYVRSSTAGTYNYAAEYWQFFPVLSLPFSGNGINNIYCYFNLVTTMISASNNLELPIFGIPCNRSTFSSCVYTTPQSGFLDFFYGYDRISGVKNRDTDSNIFYMDPTADNIEYIRRCCAAYGLFFCDDHVGNDNTDFSGGAAESTRWTHTDMMLGTIEDDGYTRGNYTHGADNANARQFNWTDSTDSTYDPDIPPIPTENVYNRQTNWNLVGDLSTLTRRYVLNSAAVQHLGRELWTISSDLIDDGGGGVDYNNLNDKILDSFLTQNPIDCIVDLRRYPMEIPKADNCLLKLGKYETIVSGYTMEKTVYNYLFELRQPIYPLFYDSFIDYEPYTHFELYIPFCGTVSIEPADILGRKLAVQLVVDFTTGTATAYVMSDNLVIKSAQGQIAIDIPVSGIQSVTAASQISNAIIDARVAKAGEIGAVGNIASVSGITRMLTNPFQTGAQISQAQWQSDRADYNLTHQNIPPHTIGAASSAASWAIDLNCRLIIYYPTGEVIREANPPEFILQKLAEYGHTTGFACCMTGQLKEFLGLTVGINADLNGIKTNSGIRPATLQELQLLEAALEEGVIL